jgi:Tfp pilus assembly protein PilN
VSRVNLLPSEIKKGQENRRRFMLFLLAGIAIVLLVFAFWFIQSMRLSDVQDQVQAQNQVNAGIQQNIASLQPYAGEVSYSQMLLDVSKVIPSDTYLTTFASTLQAPTASTSTTTTTTFVGNMTFSGETLHFDSLSTWLNRLESVQGWANPWTSNVSADASVAGAFQFDTTVDLTQDALTERGAAGTAATGG